MHKSEPSFNPKAIDRGTVLGHLKRKPSIWLMLIMVVPPLVLFPIVMLILSVFSPGSGPSVEDIPILFAMVGGIVVFFTPFLIWQGVRIRGLISSGVVVVGHCTDHGMSYPRGMMTEASLKYAFGDATYETKISVLDRCLPPVDEEVTLLVHPSKPKVFLVLSRS